MVALAELYEDGLGVKLDKNKAMKLYRTAADRATRSDKTRDGEGTEVDLGKARYWFERAAAKGHQKARQNLAGLDARV
ncbi:hypothetical protein SO694_000114103 [Aureococcus anophagefferens]|uniref:Sel1 repeat family protein n=1 Tax=Aureococcus anophagefferens TaxID=44056 RepID=A0ABR1GEW8_AURAN